MAHLKTNNMPHALASWCVCISICLLDSLFTLGYRHTPKKVTQLQFAQWQLHNLELHIIQQLRGEGGCKQLCMPLVRAKNSKEKGTVLDNAKGVSRFQGGKNKQNLLTSER